MNKKKLISISLFPVLICYGIFIFFIQTVDFFDKIKKSDYSSSNANVILIVIETLRADHLGVYGYSRNTSPFLDLFAQENVMFEYAFSTSSWTLPSVSSIFTSFYPSTIFYCMGSDELNPWFAWRIPNNFKTIAETLKENGYNTACITGNGLLNPELGYAQGFDTFLSFDNTDASCINKQVYELLDSDTFIQCPFFLYIHYYDPHKPYDPPEGRDIYKGGIIDEYDYREADLSEINKYDSEIFFIDTELEKICTYLKERELYDRSLIIITSDHGEQFHEHGDYEHGKSVYNEEIHVPLIMKLNNLRMKISHNVSLLDIYPTILDVLGLAIPHPIQGKSLIKSANKKGRRVILTEVARDVLKKAVIVDDAKLIVGFDETQFLITNKTQEKCLKIFNFKRDRWEKNPLEDKHLEKKLRSDFYDLYNQYSAFNEPCIAPDNQPSEEILNKLKSLAYLN